MEYTLKKSRRSRNVTIKILVDGKVVVTLPWKASEALAERFIKEKELWISMAQERMKERFLGKITLKQTPADYKEHKEHAREVISARVHYFNTFYQFKVGDIRIKNTSSRWGSCSGKGNLNFNYGLVKLPLELLDYVVVHELAHLKEMNHSQKFWDVVAQKIPDYKDRRQTLKEKYIHIT